MEEGVSVVENDNTITLKCSATTERKVNVTVFYNATGSGENSCGTVEGISDEQAKITLTILPLPVITIDENSTLAANENKLCAETEVTFSTQANMSNYAWNIDGGAVTAGNINSNTVTVKWATAETDVEKMVKVYYKTVSEGACQTKVGFSEAEQKVTILALPKIERFATPTMMCSTDEAIELQSLVASVDAKYEGVCSGDAAVVCGQQKFHPKNATVNKEHEVVYTLTDTETMCSTKATRSIQVIVCADLQLSSETSQEITNVEVCKGNEQEFTLTVKNSATEVTKNIEIKVNIPTELEVSTTNVNYNKTEGIWRIESLAVDATAELKLLLKGITATTNTTAIQSYIHSANSGLASEVTNSNFDAAPLDQKTTNAAIVFDLPTVVLTDLQDIVCEDATNVDLTELSSPAGGTFSGNGVEDNEFNPAEALIGSNEITYVYTDENGCSNSDITEITVVELPEVTLDEISEQCSNGKEVDLTNFAEPQGGAFSGGIYVSADGEFTPSLAAIGSNEVTYTVQANGCFNSATIQVEIENCSDLSGVIIAKTDSEANTPTGSVEVEGIRGTQPYEYSIDGGNTYQESGVFENLAPSDCVVITIRDSAGDTFDLQVRINVKPENEPGIEPGTENDLYAVIIAQENSNATSATGMVEVEGREGEGPYTYAIDGGEFTDSGLFENLATGNYVVIVKDANGETVELPVVIGQRPKQPSSDLIGILLSKTNANYDEANGSLEVVGRYGTRPYEYSINGGSFQSSGLFENLAAGDYAIIVQDSKGDTYEINVRISNPICIDVVFQKGNHTLVVNNNKNNNGGYKFTHYEWFENEIAVDARNLGSGLGYFYNVDASKKGIDLDFTAEYYVVLKDSEGIIHKSCPLQPIKEAEGTLTVYPTPLRSSEYVNVKLEGFDWKTTKIMLYSINGSLQSITEATGAVTPIVVPRTQGSYIVKIISGKQEEQRIIVRD